MNLCFIQKHIAGQWELVRTIEPDLYASGVCLISHQDGQSYFFDEKCTLKAASGASWAGERQYQFVFGESLQVFFMGLRQGLFVDLQSDENGGLYGEHQCAPDLYTMRLKMDQANQFETIVHIQGPHKNSLVISQYKRI